ncbi:galanin [Flavobacterium sp. Root935]|jgi:hypothetical protein|uniref:DUF3137 domain-containing protein n=1 Tax=unclassified Flavobacterium TaxID=196869 RepID=UPI00070FF8CD|nr:MULTISPECIES: DUF3137 domain-containing protein [unclassified Flavobacterium]KRD58639.1 galanin [Flavobacterium sp. Root935]TDX11283.1 uncharacterized protein DUF3137 [Flavobacterium sp. S87F.05.LMB.W.Kidney.N]
MDSENTTYKALQEVLNTLEIDRKKIAETYRTCYILFGLAALILAIGLLIRFPMLAFFGALVPLVIGVVMYFQIQDEVKKYKFVYKTNVVSSALKEINETFSITPQSGLPEYEFISSELFTTEPDRYKTQDLISGTADKTAFWFAEVHAEYKTETHTKNGTKTTWHTIFKGIIFVADFNKNFEVSTVVRPKGVGDAIGAWFSKNVFSFGNSELVHLENTIFDEIFVTYSRNQIEARYILTPAMMERILELNKKSEDTISLSFIDSKMYIAFPLSHNYFEAPIHSSLLVPNLLTDDLSIVQFMQDIVHELDLNTRIWGKG